MDRKREYRLRRRFGLGEGHAPVRGFVRGLPVQGRGIVDRRRDAVARERLADGVAPAAPHGELVIDMRPARARAGRLPALPAFQLLGVAWRPARARGATLPPEAEGRA